MLQSDILHFYFILINNKHTCNINNNLCQNPESNERGPGVILDYFVSVSREYSIKKMLKTM